MSALLGLLLLLGIVIAIVALVRRLISNQADEASDGHDIVAYLVLALAMGVAGFAMARLATSAFPSDALVIDPSRDLAASLPALIVASPFVVYFWRRQAERRIAYPNSIGWGVYLTIILLLFGIAFAVTAVMFINGLLGDDTANWAQAVVFGIIVGLHEAAARRSPPAGDAGEIYRVVGSAIGLFTLGIGLIGLFGGGVFSSILDGIWNDFSGNVEWLPWTAMVIVGAPIWMYYWFRPWADNPGLPRNAWLVAVTSGTMAMTLVGAVGTIATVIDATAGNNRSSADATPFFMAAGLVGLATWVIHRRSMGTARSDSIRFYEYVVAAGSLVSLVASAVTLTQLAFGDRTIVGGDASDVMIAAVWLISSVAAWLWFHTRWTTGVREEETASWPRRLYLLGVGAAFGIAAAIALIAVLVVITRRTLDGQEGGSLLIPSSIFVFSGLAAWYLLTLYFQSRELVESEEVIAPFDVTIICGHPGPVSAMLPPQARVRVIHRNDGHGIISEETAAEIVEMVGHRSSHVWVDDEGVRIAPIG